MICLENRTFAVSQTTFIFHIFVRIGCDLLGKSYFCSIANNFALQWAFVDRLWFAWKIVLLQYRKQPKISHTSNKLGCDLLGKSYFCSIANNYSICTWWYGLVVICLENRTFAVSQTTMVFFLRFLLRLWFAWKIVLLQYRKQPYTMLFALSLRCDLLGKSYFCSIANNLHIVSALRYCVVICLENRTFAVSQTTLFHLCCRPIQLWFAWKIVLLQYRKQPFAQFVLDYDGCDLLGKSYFCSIANNQIIESKRTIELWFAWKIVLLQYRKQRVVLFLFLILSCDLLGKSYFCSIANNLILNIVLVRQLWFAWKIVLLQYRKQLKHHIYLYHKQIQRFKK